MSRQRFIYPEIFTSEDFTSLSYGARLLFIGMFTTADDYGRGRGTARSLKAAVFPSDDCTLNQVETWAQEVCSRMMVRFYQIAGAVYYDIPNWTRYQAPQYKAKPKVPSFQDDARSLQGPCKDPQETLQGSGHGWGEEKRREEKRSEEGWGGAGRGGVQWDHRRSHARAVVAIASSHPESRISHRDIEICAASRPDWPARSS